MSDVNDYEMFFAVHWTSKAEFILWCACFVPLWSAARALTWRLQILEGHYGPLFKPHHIEPGEVCFLARSWRTKSVHTTLHFEDVNPHEIAKKEQHFKNICSFLTHLKKITLLALAWNKMINYDAAQVNRTVLYVYPGIISFFIFRIIAGHSSHSGGDTTGSFSKVEWVSVLRNFFITIGIPFTRSV